MNRPVLSGTQTPDLSGTADPIYREPNSRLSVGNASRNRPPNFTNVLTLTCCCQSLRCEDIESEAAVVSSHCFLDTTDQLVVPICQSGRQHVRLERAGRRLPIVQAPRPDQAPDFPFDHFHAHHLATSDQHAPRLQNAQSDFDGASSSSMHHRRDAAAFLAVTSVACRVGHRFRMASGNPAYRQELLIESLRQPSSKQRRLRSNTPQADPLLPNGQLDGVRTAPPFSFPYDLSLAIRRAAIRHGRPHSRPRTDIRLTLTASNRQTAPRIPASNPLIETFSSRQRRLRGRRQSPGQLRIRRTRPMGGARKPLPATIYRSCHVSACDVMATVTP